MMVQVLVDYRERNEDLLSILKEEPNICLEFKKLDIGDFLFPNLLVERKSLIDFCESIKDGRLYAQAGRLSNSLIRPLIIIEVDRKEQSIRSFSPEAIQGAIITLSVLYGIPILKATSPKETAKLMLQAYKQILRFGTTNHKWRRPQPQRNYKSNKRKLQLHLLQGFPGIGVERAAKLLDKFGTIRNISSLGLDELLQTPGLPKSIAIKIIDLLD